MSQNQLLSRDELLTMLKNPNFLLLDVRNPDEVEQGIIETAKTIPLSNLSDALQLSDNEFKAEYGFSKPLKSDKIVIYCKSGNRAGKACIIATDAGYTNVINYKGGWTEWSSHLVSYNLVCPLNNTLRLNAVILQKAALHSNYQNLAPVGIVSKDSLIDLLKKPNFSLIDVRNPDEVVLGMIPTALNIPLGQLGSALALPEDKFKIKYGISKPDKDEKIIFYCLSGVRSQSAAELAFAKGYTSVSNYKGSWSEWVSCRK